MISLFGNEIEMSSGYDVETYSEKDVRPTWFEKMQSLSSTHVHDIIDCQAFPAGCNGGKLF